VCRCPDFPALVIVKLAAPVAQVGLLLPHPSDETEDMQGDLPPLLGGERLVGDQGEE
jgi:hypothetical protein